MQTRKSTSQRQRRPVISSKMLKKHKIIITPGSLAVLNCNSAIQLIKMQLAILLQERKVIQEKILLLKQLKKAV